MKDNWKWFGAFNLLFAIAAIWVFWGTWSPDVVPVMPDCQWNHSSDMTVSVRGAFAGWLKTGLFVPDDLKAFVCSPWLYQEFQYVLAIYFAALAVAYFCRGQGLSRFAAYSGGLLLAFSGYWLSLYSAGHLGWYRFMTYGLFAFGLIDRAVGRGSWRHWLLLGAVGAWGMFYQPDLWFLFSLLTAAYGLFAIIRAKVFPWKGILLALATFIVIGGPGFKAGVQASAGREKQIAGVSNGTAPSREDRWIFVTNWSLPPEETLELLVPRLNGDTSCPLTLALGTHVGSGVKPYTGAIGRPLDAPSGNYRQHSIYVGFVTLLLALFGVVLGWKRPVVRFFAFAALLTYLLALGRNFEPLYRLVFALPIGDSLRAPIKWLHLTEFTLAVLAAFGADEMLRRFPSRKTLVILIVAVVVAVLDLARVNHLYLAPVDMSKAKAMNASMEMTCLRKADFSNAQVQSMQRAGLLQSLAYLPGQRDVYLVGVLKPRGKTMPTPLPPFTFVTLLGVVSLAGTIMVLLLALRGASLTKVDDENSEG